MENLFLVLMCCILCSACQKAPSKPRGDWACNEDRGNGSEFIPGGFWPCDWIPHPHVPNEQDDPNRMVEALEV